MESATSAPRALIFDIGRVIVRVDVSRALAALGVSVNLSPEQVWAAIESDPRYRDFQEGRLTPREWHDHLVSRFGLRLSFNEFCTAWNRALGFETILSDDLFAQLSKCYRLLLLSNTDPIHVAYLEANFNFPRYAHARIYSCAAGVSKPDPVIYKQAILQARAAPDQILYIDDAPAYVEAGRRAGLQTIHFHGAEPLLDELRKRGILPS